MANQQSAETENMSPADETNIFINQIDGLPNEHPIKIGKKKTTGSQHSSDTEDDQDSGNHRPFTPNADDDLMDDLPTSIIVTSIHSSVFRSDQLKEEMEDLFRQFSPLVTFHWLKSFKRLRVNFESSTAAANARLQLHQYPFNESIISCYFAQPVTPVSHTNLQLPAPVKQFLISPPASPPAGWEPREENEPLVNHDLLAALANLTPGESHEVHPPTESQPAIIVHTALTSGPLLLGGDVKTVAANNQPTSQAQKIVQTKCPERT